SSGCGAPGPSGPSSHRLRGGDPCLLDRATWAVSEPPAAACPVAIRCTRVSVSHEAPRTPRLRATGKGPHMQNGTADGPSAKASSAKASPHALDGVRVVELGTLIAGPFAGRIMADFGATVIKVENPSRPDPM